MEQQTAIRTSRAVTVAAVVSVLAFVVACKDPGYYPREGTSEAAELHASIASRAPAAEVGRRMEGAGAELYALLTAQVGPVEDSKNRAYPKTVIGAFGGCRGRFVYLNGVSEYYLDDKTFSRPGRLNSEQIAVIRRDVESIVTKFGYQIRPPRTSTASATATSAAQPTSTGTGPGPSSVTVLGPSFELEFSLVATDSEDSRLGLSIRYWPNKQRTEVNIDGTTNCHPN